MTTMTLHGGAGEIRQHWLLWLLTGVLLMIAGAVAVVAPVAATMIILIALGASLLFSGIVQTVAAFSDTGWSGRFLYLPVGLLELVVGTMLVWQPVKGAAALTLLIAAYLVAAGVMRAAVAVSARFEGWGWMLVSGVITLALGALVLAKWPVSGLWFTGIAVGVSLISQGVATVALALYAHRNGGEQPRAPAQG